MAGHTKFTKLTKPLDARADAAERRARAERAMDEEIAEHEATLAELRKARALTQTTLADALGVAQGEVSRIERQADLHVSTLARFIEATGGELALVAQYDDAQIRVKIGDIPQPAP